jgi:hypothetical protein
MNGEKKNLAEVYEHGVKILRNNNGTIDFTIIKAREFEIICGKCQGTVAYRSEPSVVGYSNIVNSWGTIMGYYETKVSYIG